MLKVDWAGCDERWELEPLFFKAAAHGGANAKSHIPPPEGPAEHAWPIAMAGGTFRAGFGQEAGRQHRLKPRAGFHPIIIRGELPHKAK